jgi:hypothetical protein
VIYAPCARSVMIRALTFDEFCVRSYRQGRSQHRFACLHNDSQVHAYCEISAAEEAWKRRWRDYAAHLRWTRKLDQLAASRQFAGLPAHPVLQQTLDNAYREAFFLSRAKGIADAATLAPAPTQVSSGQGCILEYGLALGACQKRGNDGGQPGTALRPAVLPGAIP